MKTVSCKKGELDRKWFVVNAQDQSLGRLASRVALVLRGKHTARFTPHVDTGDFVIVINVDKIRLTGLKASNKVYYTHSQYPGGLRSAVAGKVLEKHPDRLLLSAVRGMLPRTPLGRKMLTKLKVYQGAEHPHAAQQPVPLEF
ncbi:MAG: 50S ribosomal protein L13 [Deltaproteobacteria bacterium]|nr:50S ribosomal protein L13 [Deltaproteobacteria bacterium]